MAKLLDEVGLQHFYENLRLIFANQTDFGIMGDRVSALEADEEVLEVYARSGITPLSGIWLSETDGGDALTPDTDVLYMLVSASGDYPENSLFRWNGTSYVQVAGGVITSITNSEIEAMFAE